MARRKAPSLPLWMLSPVVTHAPPSHEKQAFIKLKVVLCTVFSRGVQLTPERVPLNLFWTGEPNVTIRFHVTNRVSHGKRLFQSSNYNDGIAASWN